MGFKSFFYEWRRRILSRIVKRRLDLSDVSIISMNCVGGILYHDCNSRFLSPTIDLYFEPADFIKFVNNLNYYLSLTPKVSMGQKYPIGTLEDIKIFFVHYSSCEEAIAKWEERKKRVNYDKIFVIMVERDGFSDINFENFKNVKYNKILFTKSLKYKCEDSLFMKKYSKRAQLPDIIPGRYMYSKMKLVNSIKCINN